MSSFRLKIELGNDAMLNGEDIARALREVAERVSAYEISVDGTIRGPIRDDNGNRVGFWEVRGE